MLFEYPADARLERPPASIDTAYKTLLNQTYDGVYQGLARYFPNGLKPEQERYVKIQYGWSLSGNWPEAAMVRSRVMSFEASLRALREPNEQMPRI